MLARRWLRYSQTEMAEQCGISRNYLSQIERGVADPSYVIVATLCRRLQLAHPRAKRDEK